MEKKLIGSHTEIYIGGGNSGWLTQSYATHFHTFQKRVLLTGGASVEDWMEVSDSRKSALEAEDAGFVPPPQAFIDRWNSATAWVPRGEPGGIGRYNGNTGYFELNGLRDITYAQAMDIMDLYLGMGAIATSRFSAVSCESLNGVRTTIPVRCVSNVTLPNGFCDYSALEVVRLFRTNPDSQSLFVSGSDIFRRNGVVRKWLDTVTWFSGNGQNTNKNTFVFDSFGWTQNHPFEYFRFRNTNINVDIRYYPNIGLDSLEYLVRNRYPLTASGANPITVRVHKAVYDKIMDEGNAEWHALLALAEEKEVTFATPG